MKLKSVICQLCNYVKSDSLRLPIHAQSLGWCKCLQIVGFLEADLSRRSLGFVYA